MKTFIAILILSAALTAQAQTTWHSDSLDLHRQSVALDSAVDASLVAVDLFDSASVARHNAFVDSSRNAFRREWEGALAREGDRKKCRKPAQIWQ